MHYIPRLRLPAMLPVFLVLALAAGSHAAEPLELTGDARYNLSSHVDILRDDSGTMTLADVRKKENSLAFVPSSGAVPNLGITSKPHWVRFRLDDVFGYHPDRSWLLELDFPYADSAELFLPQEDGGYVSQLLGDRLPFDDRPWKQRNLIFELGRVTHSGYYYMRVQASGILNLPMTIWAPRALSAQLSQENLIIGIYYGTLLAMLIYNAFMFSIFRDKSYIRYCEYLLLFLLLQISVTGHGYQYLWSSFPGVGNLLPTVLLGATALTAIHFTELFLEVPERRPDVQKWLRGVFYLCGLSILVALLAPLSFSTPFAIITGCITAVALLITCVLVLRRGSRPAQFFFAAWLLLLTGALLKGLSLIGLLPINALTAYAWQVGSGLEALLLSLGLADRINILRQERLSAMQQAFELDKVAHTDRLTGLHNRTYFEREFRQHVSYAEKNQSSHFAFFLVDLVGLKAINDNHGHAIGDQAVRMTARLLTSFCRQSDIVARIGGDEFAIICPRMTTADYEVFVSRVDEHTADGRIKFQEGEEIKSVPIHLSIGHAHTSKVPAGEIFEFADRDMYEKKKKFYETNKRHREVTSSGAQTVAD